MFNKHKRNTFVHFQKIPLNQCVSNFLMNSRIIDKHFIFNQKCLAALEIYECKTSVSVFDRGMLEKNYSSTEEDFRLMNIYYQICMNLTFLFHKMYCKNLTLLNLFYIIKENPTFYKTMIT